MGLPLTDYMQDVGEAHARRGVQAPYLSPGFSDFGDGQRCVGGRV